MKPIILIGSRALAIRAPSLLTRETKDFDFIGYEDSILEWLKKHNLSNFERQNNKIIVKEEMCEFEIVETGKSNQIFYDLVVNDPLTIQTDFGLVPNVNLLFTLKSSHKYLKNSPHVFKTLCDYHIMKRAGCSVLPEYIEFFKLRQKETYNYKHPSLNQKKETFFNGDGINYQWDHDSIHESQKFFEKPAYKYYAADNEEVKSDKKKFFSLPEYIRIAGAIEETSVLALERSIVPFFGKLSLKQAWTLAFSKVITSITSGFFREWVYEHAFEVLKCYPENYYEKFQNGIKQGIVIPYINKKDKDEKIKS